MNFLVNPIEKQDKYIGAQVLAKRSNINNNKTLIILGAFIFSEALIFPKALISPLILLSTKNSFTKFMKAFMKLM